MFVRCLFVVLLASLSLRSETFQRAVALPEVGDHQLTILSPTVLELSRITTKEPDPARVKEWDFVGENVRPKLPSEREFEVLVDGKAVAVQKIGFKRRAVYAPLRRRDLRIGNSLYLQLAQPLRDGARIEVKNPGGKLWTPPIGFTSVTDPLRWNPAIHVNQVGYMPGQPKRAMVGYYLGTLGEMKLVAGGGGSPAFQLIEARSGKRVFQGELVRRIDRGFPYPSYQEVWEADFSSVRTAGEYRLMVDGMGGSFPFWIHEGIAAAFTRTYALGLFHQRCGTAKELPFTRFTHAACHTEPAEVPTRKFESTQIFLKTVSSEGGENPRRTAPPLREVDASLYPFVTQGRVDVSGGHHDAGDYSKYMINSAIVIHSLVFAADNFPGAGELDNLGLPESGDGRSDLLQIAKWEADFVARMQDADGGFYFLVYPKDRRYEDDVLPDQGDPQVVWPKNTSATAAAVAALAEIASSPRFKKQFPEAARTYLAQAQKGWAFLQRAVAKHGRDGAYQRMTHYGDEFLHDDELAWAAAALFAATGDRSFERELIEHFDPDSRETRRWTWWRLYEGYGAAIRTYAFAARSGRLQAEQLNRQFLGKCDAELLAAARDQSRFANESAYGTSFPDPTKRFRTAGWYFSLDRAFDLAVGCQLDSPTARALRAEWTDALLTNLNYEGGCNPVNVTYLTGLGWKRQHDIVHQYAQNDRRALPPSGIPIGNIQAGFQFLHHYERELGTLTFPPDGAEKDPYPMYDRWGDSFNTTAEFVVVNQARGLAALSFLMGQSPLRDQPWRAAPAQVVGIPGKVEAGKKVTVRLQADGLDLKEARVVWEANGQPPALGHVFEFIPASAGDGWVEAEAYLPDGRRVFAVAEFRVARP